MKYILIFLCSFLTSFSVFGQGLFDKHPEILIEKNKIDQNKALKKICLVNHLPVGDSLDEANELKAFYDSNGIIRKMEVQFSYFYGIQRYEFYLIEECPILIEDRFMRFVWNEENNTYDASHIDGGFHGTYLFKNAQLVDEISLGHNRFEDDNIDPEETFISEFNSYLEILKKPLANED